MQIVKLDTITECNEYFSEETLHPLVSLIDLSGHDKHILLKPGFYAVLLNGMSCCQYCGWKDYDFSEGILTFVSPYQSLNIDLPGGGCDKKSFLLCFSPDLIRSTVLNEHFDDYTFFCYRQNEALHLSCCEKEIIKTCMDGISKELHWYVDEYSQALLASRIDLLLICAARFYKRQFITRHNENEEILFRTNQLLDNYFFSGIALQKGLPSADYFARMLGLSPAYFEDLLRYEAGKNTKEYVQGRQFDIACEQLLRTDKSIADIAKNLGYSSYRNFCILFKRLVGYSPNSYRTLN